MVPSRIVRTSGMLSGAEDRLVVILQCRLNAASWQCAVPSRAGRPALAGHLRGATRLALSSPVPVGSPAMADSDDDGGDGDDDCADRPADCSVAAGAVPDGIDWRFCYC